jgi:biopolymer transport protein ExbD
MNTENRGAYNPRVSAGHARPNINVTPLIDVLLVMLIISWWPRL